MRLAWGDFARIRSGGSNLRQAGRLDAIDKRILRILAEDGRITWSDLAERVNLSMTPTIRRVRKLEEQGIIEGYTAKLNEDQLVGSISVFVSVTLERQTKAALAVFEREIGNSPNVTSCFLMTGGADYLLRVVVRDLDEFQRFVVDLLSRIPEVARIQSSFALRSVLLRPFGVSAWI